MTSNKKNSVGLPWFAIPTDWTGIWLPDSPIRGTALGILIGRANTISRMGKSDAGQGLRPHLFPQLRLDVCACCLPVCSLNQPSRLGSRRRFLLTHPGYPKLPGERALDGPVLGLVAWGALESWLT